MMWNREEEQHLLLDVQKTLSLDKLTVKIKGVNYIFAPAATKGKIVTPQARNAHIGDGTERWCQEFFKDIAQKHKLYAVNGVMCRELGLTPASSADLAFCKTDRTEQKAEDIALIFEVKMGIVNNYQYNKQTKEFDYIGDYTTHKGIPSLRRSDSMLKAICKSVNIRLSGGYGKEIPILVVGNAPIASSYIDKVDNLKSFGIIQQFISLYPNPAPGSLSDTPKAGFKCYNTPKEVEGLIDKLLGDKRYFFGGMMSKKEIAKAIRIAAKEPTDVAIGTKFLDLIK